MTEYLEINLPHRVEDNGRVRRSFDLPRLRTPPNDQELIVIRRPKSTQSLVRRPSFASDSSSILDFDQWIPLVARPLSLWERGAPQSSRTDKRQPFCHVCRKLNIEGWIGKKLKHQLTLGRWGDICSECPFCRLVIDSVLQSGKHVDDHKYILLDNELSWRLCVVYPLYDGKLVEGYSNARDLRATAKTTSGKRAYRFIVCLGRANPLGQIQYCAEGDSVNERRFFGRKVDPRYANLDLIRTWLPRCQRIHGRSCEESGEAAKRLPIIRVVDVYKRIVVTAPQDCRYVTLSYVWGKCKHWKAEEEHVYRDELGREHIDLPEQLPKTLEDAIYVTRELGERYLWIDALCIIQDRKSEKHAQILRMDAIYSSSILTIAAASGPDADSGLAGISTARQVPQRAEVADGLRFALPLPDYMSLEKDKSLIWNSRGWTFQEKILSKRLLLFTPYQVYFQCSNMVWCEDTALETDRCSASTKKKWRPLRWAGDRLMGEQTREAGANLSNYMSVIQEYTKRTITNPCDGVDAIQGVLGTLELEMGTFHHGMPVDYFGPALLWQPPLGATAHRLRSDRAPFPSWSWARWDHPQGIVWQSSRLANTYLTHVSFFLYPGKSSSRIDPLEIISDLRLGRANLNRFELVPLPAPAADPIPRRMFRSKPSYVTALPKDEIPPPVPLTAQVANLLETIGCMLYIKTELVRVTIGRLLVKRGFPTRNTPGDFYRQYELVDKRGFCVGDIRMTADARDVRRNDPQEFITICLSSGYDGAQIAGQYIPTKTVGSGSNESTVKMEPSEFPVANIVLVKWVDNVAERVALGTMVLTAWRTLKRPGKWILFG